MDINNSTTNIISKALNSVSNLSLNSAKRAFDTSKTNNEQISFDFKDEDIKLMDEKKSTKHRVDVEEIQKYANYMGENLSIDDINYGLMYGRSVIADYSV